MSCSCNYNSYVLTQASASLKHVQLQGVYVALSQGDPTVWNGVFFVRKGGKRQFHRDTQKLTPR